jgi:hypothetical protein
MARRHYTVTDPKGAVHVRTTQNVYPFAVAVMLKSTKLWSVRTYCGDEATALRIARRKSRYANVLSAYVAKTELHDGADREEA